MRHSVTSMNLPCSTRTSPCAMTSTLTMTLRPRAVQPGRLPTLRPPDKSAIPIWMACASTVVVAAAFCAAGCSRSQPAEAPANEPPSPATLAEATRQLREIADRGKSRLPNGEVAFAASAFSSSRDRGNSPAPNGEVKFRLLEVYVDVIETNSLTYPFAGRITSDWFGRGDDARQYWTYFRHDGRRWTFHKWNWRGMVQPPDPFSLKIALAPPIIPEVGNPDDPEMHPTVRVWVQALRETLAANGK